MGWIQGWHRGGPAPNPLSVVLKFPQTRPCLCSLSMVLTHPVPSILFSPKVPNVLGTSCPLHAQERRDEGVKGKGPEPGEGEELENKEESSVVVKGGAKVPSSYSHSSGIWMNRQGLQRRRGHKYRSATAIFQAAPAARHSRRTRLRLGLVGRGLVDGSGRELGVGALGEGRMEGKVGEERRENGWLLVTNIWASQGSWPRP